MLNGVPSNRGVTLPELLMVLAILGIVAAAAIPGLRSGDVKRLDLAAHEVAQAIRYARSEAMRSGEVHGISISQVSQRVFVYKADLSTQPVSQEYILPHPVDRKPYDFDFDTAPMTTGTRIVNAQDPFKYAAGLRNNLLFDAGGVPIWIVTSSSTTYPLEDGKVELEYDGARQTIRSDVVTGRVTIE